MPVFLRAGGITATRTADVANDVQNPLDRLTVTVAPGGSGKFSLYEDNGVSSARSSSTKIAYSECYGTHTVTVSPTQGSFRAAPREWTVKFLGVASAPSRVKVGNGWAPSTAWKWDAATKTLTVTAPAQPGRGPVAVTY
jgi:hypothetical protein